MASTQTIATVKGSMIYKVNFVQTAAILRNIASVNVINRGDLIEILIMGGEQVVTGEIHGGIHEIAVKWWNVLLVMASLATTAINSLIYPPRWGIVLMTIVSLGVFPAA